MSGILHKQMGMMTRARVSQWPLQYRGLPWVPAKKALANCKGKYLYMLTAIINDAMKVEKCTVDDLFVRIVPSAKDPAIAVRKRERIEL